MKNGLWLASMLAAFLLAAGTVRAQSLDEKIKAMEQELGQLKEQQLEMKKEATAAAAEMPNFTYRPGDGLWVEASNRAWSLNVTYELETASYNMFNSVAHKGAPHGDIFLRRNRPYLRFCLNDCFYDAGIGWDMDSNDMYRLQNVVQSCTTLPCTATPTKISVAALQSQWLSFHFEKINPYLPRFQVGTNLGSYGSAVGFPGIKSGNQNVSSDEQITDLLSDSDASELGRRAIALAWVQIPVGPGDFTYNIEYKPGASVGDVNTSTITGATTDRRQLQTSAILRPFTRSKNPWLERLIYGIGIQTDNIDPKDTGNRGLSLTTFERQGRLTVFSTGSNIGRGNHVRFEQAMQWGYGPYYILLEHGLSNYDSDKGSRTSTTANDCCFGVHGYYFGVTNDFWVWGPKGFLTGERATAGSVLIGWGFRKALADCNKRTSATAACGGNAGSQGLGMTNNMLTARTLGIFYTLWRGARVGINYNWYTMANTPIAVQQTSGCSSQHGAVNVGKSCDVHAITLILHTNW